MMSGLEFSFHETKEKKRKAASGMKMYVFEGRVLPEHLHVTLDSQDRKITLDEENIFAQAQVTIIDSYITVTLETKSKVSPLRLRFLAEYLVRSIIDIQAYLNGIGYDLEMIKLISPDGTEQTLEPTFEGLKTDLQHRPLSFQENLEIVFAGEGIYLRRALADMKMAIRMPTDTPFFCYRAIESLRQYFRKENHKDEALSWERLREALRIERSILKGIEPYSVSRRHGSALYLPLDKQMEILLNTYKIIDRYCIFAHRGYHNLPDHEFEMLK